MTDKAKDKTMYIFIRDVANYKEGQTKGFVDVPLGLQAHVRPVKSHESSSVDVEKVVKEATDKDRATVAALYEAVTGSKPAGRSGVDKMCNDIAQAFMDKNAEIEKLTAKE